MPADANVIQEILAPAAMIPACGLLLLSTSARMNSLLARIRAFHHERTEIWCAEPAPGSRSDEVRKIRLEGLEVQTHRLLRRAGLLRVSMLQLFVAIACNLLAVIGLALRFVVEDSGGGLYTASVVVFIAGIAGMLGAMITSLVEVGAILETVRFEHARLEALVDGAPPADGLAGGTLPGSRDSTGSGL